MKRGLFVVATMAIVASWAGGPSHADQLTYGSNQNSKSGFPQVNANGNANSLLAFYSKDSKGDFSVSDLVIRSLAAIVGVVSKGDVAITSAGVLYGASNKGFFSLNLKGLDSLKDISKALTVLNKSTPPLKVVLDATGTGLYGQDRKTGQWYSLGFNGSYSKVHHGPPSKPGTGGITAAPEPSTFLVFGLGGLGIAAHALYRRRRGKTEA